MRRWRQVSALALVWTCSAATADIVDDAIHVFHDERTNAAMTVYVALLGDYGLSPDDRAALDATSRRHLDLLAAYLKKKSVIIANYEIVYPDQLGSTIQHFKELGIDYVARANNHTGDHGDAFNFTIETALRQAGVIPFGQKRTPQIEFEQSGQRFVVLNAAGNTNLPTDYPLSIYDGNFQAMAERFVKTDADVHIFYSHLGGLSDFITRRQRQDALEFMNAGTDVVVFTSRHTSKGHFWHAGRLALMGPGDFLFPNSGREYTPTYVPLLGFQEGRVVYFEAVVIESRAPGYFRLAAPPLRNELVARVTEFSTSDRAAAYRDGRMGAFLATNIPKVFDPDYFRRLRWKHVQLGWWYVYYNLLSYVLGIGALGSIGIILLVRRRKQRKMRALV